MKNSAFLTNFLTKPAMTEQEIETLAKGACRGRKQTQKELEEVVNWAYGVKMNVLLLEQVLVGRLDVFCEERKVFFVNAPEATRTLKRKRKMEEKP